MKYTIKRYDGDDKYSWAVFYSSDINHLGNQIFYGEATPIASGLSRHEAILHKKTLDRRNENEK